MNLSILGLAAFSSLALSTAVSYAQQAEGAQDYPSEPITLVVAFSPGGPSDNLARVISDRLAAALGDQPVVVENRSGASGYVGWRSIQDAEPDGHTILLAENALAINKALRPEEPLDPREAFEAIGRIGVAPIALAVHKDVPAESIEELAEYSQDNEISYSSSGVGSVTHMTTEALADATGIRALHVPYRGGGEATAALVGGHVQMMHSAVGNYIDYYEEGDVDLLSVSSDQRLEALPDVPTLEELGIDTDVELRFWWGLFVPAGTPEAVKQKLENALSDILDDPELVERMREIQVEPAFASASEFADILDREITSWSSFVEDKGITIE